MIHILDFDGKIVDFFSRKDESIIEANHLINIDEDVETFDFTVVSDRGEFVRERNRVVVEISDNKFREFIIIKTTDDMDGYTEVNCVGAHLEDIAKARPMFPQKLMNLTLDECMYEILRGTGWELGDVDFQGDKDYVLDTYKSPFELMKEIKELYGHEYRFEVKIEGNQIVQRLVHCLEPKSIFNGREIVYGKDLVGMTRTVDTSEVATAYLVIGPEYAKNERLSVEVYDDVAQNKFGIKGDYLWGVFEPQEDEIRKGVTTTTTSTTTVKKTTTTTTKKIYTRATTRVVGTKRHTVRKGEDLYKIATKYGVTQTSIKEANNLKSSTVKVGQILKIIITEKVTTTTTKVTTKKPPTTTTTTTMSLKEQTALKERMETLGKRQINKVNEASLSYEVTSLDIHKQFGHEIINVGDKVRIKNRDFKPPLYADARVIEVETDIIAQEQTYKFGSIKEYKESSLRSYFNSLRKEFTKKLNDGIDNIDTIVVENLEATDLFERNIEKGEFPPDSPSNGDLWYDTTNPNVAVLREYRDGEWVGATAEDVSQIGGQTTEQVALSQLMSLYANITGEMNGLEATYREVLNNEYLKDETVKTELTTAYNNLTTLFQEVTTLITPLDEATVTMDELDNLNNQLIDYKYAVTDFYMLIEKAKVFIQEHLKILQSQFTQEKFDTAMSKMANAINGAYDPVTGILTANIPNQQYLDAMKSDLTKYTDNAIINTDKKIVETKEEISNTLSTLEQQVVDISKNSGNLLSSTDIANSNLLEYNSTYVKNGIITFKKTSAYSGLKITATMLEPNKEYVMAFNYRKTGGTLTAFGGHMDATWSSAHVKTTIDGKETVIFSDPKSVFVADDMLEHRVEIFFKTGTTVTSSHVMYIQPNRGDTTLVTVEINGLTISQGSTSLKYWRPSDKDAPLQLEALGADASKQVEALELRVKTNEGSISNLNGQISLKANSSDVTQIVDSKLSPIKTLVDENKASLDVQAKAIESKVSQTTYTQDMLGVVKSSAFETYRTQTAKDISDRVTLTQYNTDSKNTATKLSSYDSQISSMGSAINLRVTKTEYDNANKLLSQAINSINLALNGVTITSSADGKISNVYVSPNGVTINGDKIVLGKDSSSDVVIENGITKIKTARITDAHVQNITLNKLIGGELLLGGYTQPYLTDDRGNLVYDTVTNPEDGTVTTTPIVNTNAQKEFIGDGTITFRDTENRPIFQLSSDGAGADRFSVGELTVGGPILGGFVPSKDTGNTDYFVETNGSQTYDQDTGNYTANSIQDAIDNIPDIINYTHTVYIDPSITYLEEDVTIRSKSGSGEIVIYLYGQSLGARFSVESCQCRVMIAGVNGNSGLLGMYNDEQTYMIQNFHSQYLTVAYLSFSGNNTSTLKGVYGVGGGNTYVIGCDFSNVDDAVSATNLHNVYTVNNKGVANRYGHSSWRGASVNVNGTFPLGKINDFTKAYSGNLNSTNASNPSGTTTTSVTTKPPTTVSTTKTKTWSTTNADYYAYSGYNRWASPTRMFHYGYAIQGMGYGSPAQVGAWFFGSDMRDTLKGKTIKKVTVKIRRRSNIGNKSNAKIQLRMHKYTSRPSTAPAFSTTYKEIILDWEESKTIDVTEQFKTLMDDGTWAGFGVKPTSQTVEYYAELYKTLTVTVTYV